MSAVPRAGRRSLEWAVLVLVAAGLLALRLPFLPLTLDDIDSVNFDLGVHTYDPVRFQPHPPGYPVYIFLAKLGHRFFTSHAAGLAFLSAFFSAISVIPLYFLIRRLLIPRPASRWGAALVCLLTLLNPLVWFNSVRPMSDLTGFFFVTAAQCLLLTSLWDNEAPWQRRRFLWLLGAGLAGISVGVRLQAIWLVGPLLLYGTWRLRSVRLSTVFCFSLAVALWLVPLVSLSGGVARFLQSFSLLLSAALPTEPLLSRFTLHRAAFGAVDVLLSPWQAVALGGPILLLAGMGSVILAWTDRRLLALISLLFVPYAVYDYLLQDINTIRYTIPIVPLVAFLASIPIVQWARRVGFVTSFTVVSVATTAITLPALAAYHSTPSPPFQALTTLNRLEAAPGSIVVSGQRVFERYLTLLPKHDVMLPTPRGGWETLVTYWKQGGRKPVLFMKQRNRTSLLRFGRDGQRTLGRWRWPKSVRPFMGGERPDWVELVRLDPPEWFCESGFLVTGEAGPVEKVLREKARLHVRASSRRRALLISGFLSKGGSAVVSLNLRNRRHREWTTAGEHFALRTLLEPLPGPGSYVPISLEATSPAVFTDVWLEPEDQPLIRPSYGFYFAERDEEDNLFQWIAPEAIATGYLPARRGRLTIEGWIPVKYYNLPLALSLDWNGRPFASFKVSTEKFRLEHELPRSDDSPWGELTIRSSQSFVPDQLQKNGDRRTLAVRIYQLALN